MHFLCRIFLFSLLITGIFGCSKNDAPDPEKPGTDTLPSSPTLPSGVLYIDCGGEFRKINVVDSSLVWEVGNSNLTGSAGCAMLLDATAFYTGSTGAVAAFSTATGDRKWYFSWAVEYPGPLRYREPVVNDSLAFFTSSTNGFNGAAKIYCVNKNDGSRRWSAQIDSGSRSLEFNSTPVLSNDKVILVTQDNTNQRHLTAYRISDGARLWSSAVNGGSATRLEAANGRVYSFARSVMTCYNAADGSMQWQTDESDYLLTGTATFFENDRLMLVRLYESRYDVLTLNVANGALLKKASVQAPTLGTSLETDAFGCIYNNNKLVVTSKYGNDSLILRCYDLSNQTTSWQKHFEHKIGTYLPEMFTPIFANNYIIFPTNNAVSNGDFTSFMYFLDMEGKKIKKIPFLSGTTTQKFVYVENGVIYNQDNRIISW